MKFEETLLPKLSADGGYAHLQQHVQKNIPALIRLMATAFMWRAESLSQYINSTKYPDVTGLALICVNNSCCVVHTLGGYGARLTDTVRGCLSLAKAHKELDMGMKFLTKSLYFIVHGPEGEEWCDRVLKNNTVLHTKKSEARALVRVHARFQEKDKLALAAFDEADTVGRREKEREKASKAASAAAAAAAASAASTATAPLPAPDANADAAAVGATGGGGDGDASDDAAAGAEVPFVGVWDIADPNSVPWDKLGFPPEGERLSPHMVIAARIAREHASKCSAFRENQTAMSFLAAFTQAAKSLMNSSECQAIPKEQFYDRLDLLMTRKFTAEESRVWAEIEAAAAAEEETAADSSAAPESWASCTARPGAGSTARTGASCSTAAVGAAECGLGGGSGARAAARTPQSASRLAAAPHQRPARHGHWQAPQDGNGSPLPALTP
jgi:hypothetical protein